DMAAFQAAPSIVSVRRSGSSETARSFVAEFVSDNYFDLMGVQPAAGRLIRPSHKTGVASPVAVISYHTWENHYGRDPNVVGSAFSVKGKSFTVIGVASGTFYGETLRSDPPDFWLPLGTEPLLNGTNNLLDRPDLFWLYVIGRVPPPTHLRALETKINAQAKRWYLAQGGSRLDAGDRMDIDRQYIPLTSASGGVGIMSIAYRNGLMLLMSLSSLVLLIACANVANLLLARGTASRAQTSLRLALGASRSRIVRQALTNSVILSLLGGSTGLFVAFAATRLILLLAFRGAHYVPISSTPSLPVLGFALAVSFATGLIFGIVPAWLETHSDPADALRGASRSTPTATALPQKLLIVMQAALSLLLLIGAGLLAQSLRNLEHQHFGFRTDGRVIVNVNPNFVGYTEEHLAGSYRRLQEQLSQIPGVISASLSLYMPMSGNNWNTRIYMEKSAIQPDAVSFTKVGLKYFETIGTRLLHGRTLDERDRSGSPNVAVVNQTFVHRFLKDQNPLGRHFGVQIPGQPLEFEIVGVVEDAKYQNAYKPAYPTFFVSLLQMDREPNGSLARSNYINNIELHVQGNAGNLEPQIRKAIDEADSNLSVVDVLPYKDLLSTRFNQERLIATLTELFGTLALILASLGLYGVVALSVARRTAEIGVRIALGATRERVIGMILRGALAQVMLGISVGLPLTIGAARLLQHQLFGISTSDPATLVSAVLVLGG
ncbi:MAG: ABC transporter permease, partial [Acidobacteriaceae bacterium]|nr:ABC transporter permease [Acidobacteriaceae bacterium]